jgi:hypothetical protein
VAPQTLRLRFRDDGTGSTDYRVEFRQDLAPTNTWEPLTNVAPGVFQADVVPPPGDKGFFRVAGLRVLTASFDSSGTQADEGAGWLAPGVVFNGTFQGTVRYTVSGTLGTNIYTTPSGTAITNIVVKYAGQRTTIAEKLGHISAGQAELSGRDHAPGGR